MNSPGSAAGAAWFAVHVRLDDAEPVLAGHHRGAARGAQAAVAAAEAVRRIAALEDPRGHEVFVPRAIAPREVHRIRGAPQTVGRRYLPDARCGRGRLDHPRGRRAAGPPRRGPRTSGKRCSRSANPDDGRTATAATPGAPSSRPSRLSAPTRRQPARRRSHRTRAPP
ncbi:hypothetical protein QFZ66_003257 [Streptomyces sp. B4I13]|uniref:hypothetical protein n=1 Tax=Streptomyces sp. B4I13 TaxID=3042271 RepID=UPI00278236AA|nr:hypothetical protein [Streptomyces sp. B4I13]MDQ0959379.1 hypothetical protein [Streptomyces sp. B4I13]